MALLELKNLKTFFATKRGTVKAVNGVSYSLDAGKVLGVVGESGSGKSVSAMSILRLLDGNGYIDSGEILFNGQSILGRTPRAITRAGMARSFQVAQLFPQLSVLDNLLIAVSAAQSPFPPLLAPMRNASRIAQADAILAEFDNSRWVRISTDGSELMCGLVTDAPSTDPILTRLPVEPTLRMFAVHELLHVWGGHGDLTTIAPISLDQFDEALLSLLAVDGRAQMRTLAEHLGVNASTVSRRRQRLVDAGVLYFEADVDPQALGGTGDAMLWMRVPPGAIRAAGAALRSDVRVRFAAATSGSYDLVAHVHVIDHQAILGFVDETLAELQVSATDVVPMGRVLKRNAV